MSSEPTIATVAALFGDTGRAAMLAALADGRALPAGELATAAGVSAQAASAHLAKLLDGGLLAMEREGRHRYYRLAGPEVGALLEGLASFAGAAPRGVVVHSREGRELRFARTCYDHLAGELGVAVAGVLEQHEVLAQAEGKRFDITPAGRVWLASTLDIDVAKLKPGRKGVACQCLDWTERRYHVAGPLGRQMLTRFHELGWLTPRPGSRALQLTSEGKVALQGRLKVVLPEFLTKLSGRTS